MNTKLNHYIIIALFSSLINTLLGGFAIMVNFPYLSPLRFLLCMGVITIYNIIIILLINFATTNKK